MSFKIKTSESSKLKKTISSYSIVSKTLQQVVTDLKEKPLKKYSYAVMCVWVVALLSMSALTLKDAIQLADEYYGNRLIINQELVDASKEGVKLPNATVCVRYYPSRRQLDEVRYENFSYFNFSKFQFRQAFEFATRLNFIDYATTTLRNWDPNAYAKVKNGSISENQSPNDVLMSFKGRSYTFRYTEENLHRFWNNFASMLCANMRPRLYVAAKGARFRALDICKEAANGVLPFTVVDNSTVCFRVPLDIISMKTNDAVDRWNNTLEEDEDTLLAKPVFKSKCIVFSFQPLILRQLLFGTETMEKLPPSGKFYQIAPFFPEAPLSYINRGFRLTENNWVTHSTQFYHEYNYLYGLANNIWIPLYFSIGKKEKKYDDSSNCTDAYDETNCIIRCVEDEFIDVCRCNRFMYRDYHHRDVDYPFCTVEHYLNCSDRYKSTRVEQMAKYNVDNFVRCQKRCSKCSKIKFNYYNDSIIATDSVQPDWIRCDIFKDFFSTKLGQHETNETAHSKFCTKDIELTSTPKTIMDEYAGEIVEFADEHGGALKSLYYEALFGRVYYVLSIDTENFYPVWSETKMITEDAFKSQIGGILGLYLGFSCLTGFETFAKVLNYFKKRIAKRRNKARSLSMHAAAVLNFWHILGIRNVDKEQRNAGKRNGPQYFNDGLDDVHF